RPLPAPRPRTRPARHPVAPAPRTTSRTPQPAPAAPAHRPPASSPRPDPSTLCGRHTAEAPDVDVIVPDAPHGVDHPVGALHHPQRVRPSATHSPRDT